MWKRSPRTPAFLFLLALLIYAPGIGWGLPTANAPDRVHPWGVDEIAPLGFGELYFTFAHPANARYDPRYPLCHYFVQALAIGPYLALLAATGGISHFASAYPYGLTDPVRAIAVMTVLGRLPSLLMAAGLVVVAYRTGARLWDERTGLLTAILVLLIRPLPYYAHTSNVDVAALFWTALGLAVFVECLLDRLTTRRAVGLGILAALAVATKDISYGVFLVVPPVLLWKQLREKREAETEAGWRAFLRDAGLGAGVAAVLYVTLSGLVFNRERFQRHLDFILHGSAVSALRAAYGSTPATLTGYADVVRNTAVFLVDALGPLTAAFVGVGLFLCWRRRRFLLAFALPALGVWAGVILPVRFVEYRFLLPITYVLVFFAAHAVASAASDRRAWVRGATWALFLSGCGWSALRGADLAYQTWHDSRYEAGQWLARTVRAGDRVAYTDGAYKLPALAADVVALELPPRAAAARVIAEERPELIVVIPNLRLEVEHEHLMSEDVYQGLRDGALGYVEMPTIQTRALFSNWSLPYVNPPVKVLVRRDLLSRIRAAPDRRSSTTLTNPGVPAGPMPRAEVRMPV